ncbi:MAG: ABC transporter permease [Thermoguttaceae bacterium]|jgi:putative ABC transport system permease protein|nr:ABC transporter permease [Thermoguttaceae bacterium]
MKAVWMLVGAQTRRHGFRLFLASLATAASVCLVIWVVGGYDVLIGRSAGLAEQMMAPYDAVLQTQRAADEYPSDGILAQAIDSDVLEQFTADADVALLEPVMAVRTTMLYPVGRGRPGAERRPSQRSRKKGPAGPKAGQKPAESAQEFRPRGPGGTLLTGTTAARSPFVMVEGRWLDLRNPERMEAVLSSSAAGGRGPGLKVGDVFMVRSLGGEFRLTLVGIVDQPTHVRSVGGIYTSMTVARKISGQTPRINRVYVALKDEATLSDFAARWQDALQTADPPLALTDAGHLRAQIDEGRSLAILEQQRFYATGVSILAATFIILTTLSMGISERIREFAMLRAIGMTRGQIGWVVFGESTVIAAAGWLLGLGAGWGLLQLDAALEGQSLARAVPLSLRSVLVSAACVAVGAGVAAALPARVAMRLKPLDVMATVLRRRRSTLPVAGVIAGAALIAVNPLLVYGVSISAHLRYAGYLVVGCTSMALGFVLVAPLAVVLVERLLGPAVAALMGLSRHLVAEQLSGNLWRSVGTVACLTVGLGLFVSIQVWGHSMAVPFLPGDNLPDVVVSFLPSGLPESDVDAVYQVDGIIGEECVPMAVEQAKAAPELLQCEGLSRPRQKAVYLFMGEQDNILFLGVDPPRAFGGSNPPIGLVFVKGDRQTALDKLGRGRYCLVPDHFHVETGLGVGDWFSVIPPHAPDSVLTWEIVGVVSIPGWQWVTKMSDMRRYAPKTLASVFVSYEGAKEAFGLERVYHFWANTIPGTDSGSLRTAMQAIADRNTNVEFYMPDVGQVHTETPYASVTDVREVERTVRWRTESVLWMMSKFPLIVLAITTLAVANTIMASVRARRWELGVLRAVGLTRGGLTRLVVAESILVGLVACVLSLTFGITAAWCATGICTYIFYFGGLQPPLVIPWTSLSWSFAVTLGLCMLAGILPAVAAGRTEPARLLQAGRAAM